MTNIPPLLPPLLELDVVLPPDEHPASGHAATSTTPVIKT
jgi:hypothetical protein